MAKKQEVEEVIEPTQEATKLRDIFNENSVSFDVAIADEGKTVKVSINGKEWASTTLTAPLTVVRLPKKLPAYYIISHTIQ